MQSPGNKKRLDTVEEISHNKLKYTLCYEKTYFQYLFAGYLGTNDYCTAMRQPQQPLLPEPREVGEGFLGMFCITFQEILGWSQLVNY